MKRRPHRASAQRAHGLPTPSRSRYAPWRAATLGLVYLLMAAHIAHWLIAGKTLAPLELNEVMYTFELGIVTAGFLFMATVLLATAIFGRFFCSWGCHILALQDLSTWVLKKVGVRPKAIRSRFLAWVPVIAAVYMFAWPQVMRIWEGRSIPRLHIATDATGWASFTTENFWRNLPGPGIIAVTFVVCGFVAVYLLGSRGFCRYACPYGVLLGLADRVATGRIRVGDDCLECGICTSVCGSHVRVHEELARFGTVVNPACLKDLDCISACPQQSLHYGFGLPSLVQPAKGKTRVRKRYDFSLWEEAMMMLVFAALLPILRGLYDALPFLLSITLAGIGAYGSIVLVRLTYQQRVRLNRWPLKAGGRFLRVGKVFVAVMVTLILLAAHSGVVHYHSYEGRRHFALSKDGRADPELA
ncbi:MAG: 4Fe-4S binding protein, partial [Planctomycetes bacterium]|nr:4Fe-4S binding protein [Planctomycetota bacterium]